MHLTAYENCLRFYDKYVVPTKNTELPGDGTDQGTDQICVIEFGSYDVNGTLRPIFEGCRYIGLDLSPGPGVDVVVEPGTPIPLDTASADIVVSSSNFEHDPCFWETFLEMCRLVKPGGYIYINAPSAGPYHGFPGDAWRFYSDSWKYLANWANKQGHQIELAESYIDDRSVWRDNVGIFVVK
jgi:SAM-dependent methyltransferase